MRSVSAVAPALKPKNNTPLDSHAWTRIAHASSTFVYRARPGAFRASLKVIGRPRPYVFSISELDRVDPRELQYVITILDGNVDK